MHGVIIQEQASPLVPISAPATSVIGIVGTAPSGGRAIQVITSKAQAEALYGPPLKEYSLVRHLHAIFNQGSAKVLAVNVFDPATMYEQVTDEAKVISSRRIVTTYFPLVGTQVVRTAASGGGTLLALGTDYSFGNNGEIIIKNAAYANGSTLYVTYKRSDETAVTSSTIIGADGLGLSAFETVLSTHGITPNILIAPMYSELPAVGAELLRLAKSFRGTACIDIGYGLTPAQAIADRAPGENSDYSDPDAVLVYPAYTQRNPREQLLGVTNYSVVLAASAIWAGLVAKNDATRGYQWSPTNLVMNLGDAIAAATLTSKGLDDANSEVNQLNDAGIVTYMPLGGMRIWGNRTSAYPASTAADESFIAVRRVENIIHRMILNNALPFVGRPLVQVQIDIILNSIRQALNVLIGEGRLIDGKVEFLPEQNSPAQLTAGQVTFQITMLPPSPAELIIFQSVVDPSLNNLV